ncbi:MAG: winged helix-turn-helix domain-containing protein [Anaerolineae bacterium]
MEEETVDANEAFAVLAGELKRALEEAQTQSIEASRRGRYGDVQKATQKVNQVASALERLEGLRSQWDELATAPAGLGPVPPVGRGRGGKKRQKVPRGSRTPDEAFQIPILTALNESGGRERTQRVVDRVGELMEAVLRETDYGVLSDGRTVRWRTTAMWCRWNMVRRGLLVSGSPRGVWEITEKGRQYLREHGAAK